MRQCRVHFQYFSGSMRSFAIKAITILNVVVLNCPTNFLIVFLRPIATGDKRKDSAGGEILKCQMPVHKSRSTRNKSEARRVDGQQNPNDKNPFRSTAGNTTNRQTRVLRTEKTVRQLKNTRTRRLDDSNAIELYYIYYIIIILYFRDRYLQWLNNYR